MENEDRWKYEVVDINLIDEAELNANEMTAEDFAALCDNIEMSGMSSVPCCYKKENGRYVMISGHHRLRACKKLRYTKMGILWCGEWEMTEDEIIAVQLSHNALHGQDNQSILKKLFSQIKSVDYKKFAHVNVDEISPIGSGGFSVYAMKENFVFSVILYPNSFDVLDELYGDVREQAKKSDVVILADQNPNEGMLMKLQQEIGKEYDIKSPSIVFSKLLELANERLTEIRDNK